MKQLVIGIVLAILLVGCGEKPKFSISKHDTVETYDNNPIFEKISYPNGVIAYNFSDNVISIQGIKTDDLEVEKGSVIIISPKETVFLVNIIFKGENTVTKLLDRLKKVGDKRNMKCGDSDDEISCYWDENDKNVDIVNFMLVYSKKTDNVNFFMIINKK